jgi:hypothetical protein
LSYRGGSNAWEIGDSGKILGGDTSNLVLYGFASNDILLYARTALTATVNNVGINLASGKVLQIDGSTVVNQDVTTTAGPTFDHLHLNGGYFGKVTVVTNTYSILASDETVICNRTTAFTATLPAAVTGQRFNIKNINIGTVTVEGDSSDTIDGQLNQTLGQWDSMTVVCQAANTWVII